MIGRRVVGSALDASVRRFASQAAKPSAIQQILFDTPTQNPLNEEFPGVPALIKGAAAPASSVQTSKLANGVTVVSQDQGGATASVGLYIKAGSRYETVPGTANVLEHLAFASTQKRSAAKIQRDAEDAGAVISARSSRESFVYSGEVLRDGAPALLSLIAEAATAPKLWSWEVNEGKESFADLVAAGAAIPERALIEGVHAAAFGPTSALGHGLYVTPEGLGDVSSDTLRAFLGATLSSSPASSVVVSGVNVSHADLAKAADRALAAALAGSSSSSSSASAGGVKSPKPVFLGGETTVRTTGAGGAYVALALPAPSLTSAGSSLHALGVLQALLGSGGAAAGAPRLGPARQSRLARSLHTEGHSFIRSISAFAIPYSDAGLVGLAGSCADHEASRLAHAMVGFLKDAAGVPATAAELERAKKSYKLALAADAESRAGARDDMGLTALLTGAAPSLAASLRAIDAVTAADVQAVARSALAAPPAFSVIGSLVGVPRYDQIAALMK